MKKLLLVGIVMHAGLAAAHEGKIPGPCKQIAEACQTAGFIKGDWKKGDGLYRDCVNPIIQGQTTVPGATKSLPTVDANLVAACKAKNPKFGAAPLAPFLTTSRHSLTAARMRSQPLLKRFEIFAAAFKYMARFKKIRRESCSAPKVRLTSGLDPIFQKNPLPYLIAHFNYPAQPNDFPGKKDFF